MKHDSEIGVAIDAGHPCYFVGFLPDPVPGQTVEDGCRAEAIFVSEVVKGHTDAGGIGQYVLGKELQPFFQGRYRSSAILGVRELVEQPDAPRSKQRQGHAQLDR